MSFVVLSPVRLLQTRRRGRADHAAGAAAFSSSVRPCALTCSTRSLIDVWGWFRERSRSGRHRVQIDRGTGRQQRLLIEDRHALEPRLEERTPRWSS